MTARQLAARLAVVGVVWTVLHVYVGRFAAQLAGFDLQLSGHTHGGQYFPFNPLELVPA
jgi:predicted MPP superfamily phosphohydrolase